MLEYWIEAICKFFVNLSKRSQVVSVNGCISHRADLVYGVPQGSVLGPVLFVMYTRPLLLLLEKHSVKSQSFADDTQLYTHTDPSDIDSTVQLMQECIGEVKSWMTFSKLKLNDDKTEALLFCNNKSRSTLSLPNSIQVASSDILFKTSTRNLGYIISDNMSTNNFINHICRSAYTAIRQISSFRHYLTVSATKTLVCALVLARIDYCNSLLSGAPKQCIEKLQKVQNSAARLVLKAKNMTMLLRYFTHFIGYLYKLELITNWLFSVTTSFLTHLLPILLNFCRSTHPVVSYALLQTHVFSVFLRHELKLLAKGHSLFVQPNNGILYHYTSVVFQLPSPSRLHLRRIFSKCIYKINETTFVLMISVAYV